LGCFLFLFLIVLQIEAAELKGCFLHQDWIWFSKQCVDS
jgi:hypothetical protein